MEDTKEMVLSGVYDTETILHGASGNQNKLDRQEVERLTGLGLPGLLRYIAESGPLLYQQIPNNEGVILMDGYHRAYSAMMLGVTSLSMSPAVVQLGGLSADQRYIPLRDLDLLPNPEYEFYLSRLEKM